MKKVIFIIILCIIAIVGFCWLSSFYFRLSFSNLSLDYLREYGLVLSDIRSYPFDIFYYANNYPEHDKVIKRSFFLSALTFALPFILFFLAQPQTFTLFGSARFAKIKDLIKHDLFLKKEALSKKGLFAGTNIILGKFKGRFIVLKGQLSCFLAAGTRSGKGVGMVIPNLLAYAHSIVVLDVKRENYRITSGFRRKCGHEIFLFDPFDPDFKTSKWNPLHYVRRESHLRVTDIDSIAISLIAEDPKDKFFVPKARTLFLGLALYLFDQEKITKKEPTVRAILDLATGNKDDFLPYFKKIANDPICSEITKQTILSSIGVGEKTFSNVHGTLLKDLAPWFSDTVSNATNGNDFDFRDIRKQKMTLYIGIKPNTLDKTDKILNLFYSQLINLNTETLPEDDASLKYQCLLLMDEATAPRKIEILASAISYMAGYNLRLLTIAQTPSQFIAHYGQDLSDVIIENHAARSIFGTRKFAAAKEFSEMLGKRTIKAFTGYSVDSKGKRNKNYQLQGKPLMFPEEFIGMKFERQVITLQDLPHPIFADKIIYYKDPVFTKRLGYEIADYPYSLPSINNKKPAKPINSKLADIFAPAIKKFHSVLFNATN